MAQSHHWSVSQTTNKASEYARLVMPFANYISKMAQSIATAQGIVRTRGRTCRHLVSPLQFLSMKIRAHHAHLLQLGHWTPIAICLPRPAMSTLTFLNPIRFSKPAVAQPGLFCQSQSGLRTIKHIHKLACSAFGTALADVLDKVVKGPSDGEAWQDFLSFGSNFLRVPESGGKQRNLTSVLLKRLKAGRNPSDDAPGHTPSIRPHNPEATRAAAIAAKVDEGNLSAAVRTYVQKTHQRISVLLTLQNCRLNIHQKMPTPSTAKFGR